MPTDRSPVRTIPKKSVQVQFEPEPVEMRSICIQAEAPRRKHRKLTAAEVSRRSIGVGSICIDETVNLDATNS
jgi:hypothetical protein